MTGELKSNHVEDGHKPAWLDLATYAQEDFRTQERRFVVGFILYGLMMRLWQFDSSGSSRSCSFDIDEDGFKLVQVVPSYRLMNIERFGLDPTIWRSDCMRCLETIWNNKIERLILTKDVKKHAVIAGRTTCWKAYHDGDELKEYLIVKESWQSEERPEEEELIKEALFPGSIIIRWSDWQKEWWHHWEPLDCANSRCFSWENYGNDSTN